jgi:hypothetical protein
MMIIIIIGILLFFHFFLFQGGGHPHQNIIKRRKWLPRPEKIFSSAAGAKRDDTFETK